MNIKTQVAEVKREIATTTININETSCLKRARKKRNKRNAKTRNSEDEGNTDIIISHTDARPRKTYNTRKKKDGPERQRRPGKEKTNRNAET